MNEYSYYADCAGLHYDVTLAKSGLNLSFFGYQDKLPVLILKTLDRLKNLSAHCDESLFSRKKEKLMQDYSNYLFWQPYSHCIHNTAICLEEPRWSSAEKRASLSTIELGDFQSYARQIVTLLKVEVFVHGNSTAEEALQISTSIHNTLGSQPLPFAMEPIRRVVAIEPGYSYVYRTHCKNCNPAEKNSAIQNLYLVTDEESSNDIKSADDKPGALASEAMLDLVAHLLSEPAFDQLRTKEQLGYIVHTSKTDVGHLLGLRIIVQSNSKDGHYLDGRIESFLEQYRTTLLADMTLEELNTNIRATIEKLIEKPKNLDEETGALWDEIRKTMYLFDRKALKADYLRGVLKANKECKDVSDCNFLKDIKSFYDIHLRAASDCRRKFSAQFYGQGTKYPSKESILPPKTILIEEPGHFKRDMQLLKIKTASV